MGGKTLPYDVRFVNFSVERVSGQLKVNLA